jgi:cobaltochelatase CobS
MARDTGSNQYLQDAARVILRDYPTMNVGRFVTHDARGALRTLAQNCGVTIDASHNATDADLLGLWRIALKSPDAAMRGVHKLNARLDPYATQPAPTPAPYVPDAYDAADAVSPADLMRAIREAQAPLEARIQAMDDDARADFASLLASASASTLDAMRDALASEAHKAAVKALATMQPTRVEITRPDMPSIPLGLAHCQVPRLIRYLASGGNVYLYGPAGSGKTTVCDQVAKAFGVKPYYAAKISDEFQLLGFMTPGKDGPICVRTAMREAYEFGGVLLWDEFDASDANAVAAMNMATANKICQFPDALVHMHPDFKLIAAGNTALTGATEEYQGRNQQDGAAVDRFDFLRFDYDLDLERAIAPNADWCAYVQAVRDAVAAHGLKHLVTPRATLRGAALLASGDTWDEAADATIWKGLDRDTVQTLRDAARHAFKG